jgi:hypothetical protein
MEPFRFAQNLKASIHAGFEGLFHSTYQRPDLPLCNRLGQGEDRPGAEPSGALKPVAKGHHAAITADELPEFIRAFEKIEGRMYVPTKVMPDTGINVCITYGDDQALVAGASIRTGLGKSR